MQILEVTHPPEASKRWQMHKEHAAQTVALEATVLKLQKRINKLENPPKTDKNPKPRKRNSLNPIDSIGSQGPISRRSRKSNA